MRMYDLIVKKKKGLELSGDEIAFMIAEYTNDNIPDYQMSAMTMAICFNGMSREETYELTEAMAKSGEMLDLSMIKGPTVDKHSTGGVGDKTSLALGPMAAACGVKVAKMSGAGLGHTGGTTDKLKSIRGFRTDISTSEFIDNVNRIGIAIMGQTKNLAPADKKLYALRDVTATVDSIPLIASSIMSKKLAAGAKSIVLDVKTGSGAFMKNKDDALKLAGEMVEIGKRGNRNTIAVITNMDEPLGYMVGNALEFKEAIDTLRGNGPSDFTRLCYTLGSYMLVAGGISKSREEALEKLENAVTTGAALDKLAEFVEAQGGDREYIYNTELLPKAHIIKEVKSHQSGCVQRIACDEVGMCSLVLGGGRLTKESEIDLSVGLELKAKVGDYINEGDTLAIIHANDEDELKEAALRLIGAYTIGEEKVNKSDVIIGAVD